MFSRSKHVYRGPIYLIYLDGGQVPTTYTVYKFKLNFLQYIMHQKESSLLYGVLETKKTKKKLSQCSAVRGNWLSECDQIFEEFETNLSMEEIRMMKRYSCRKRTEQMIVYLELHKIMRKLVVREKHLDIEISCKWQTICVLGLIWCYG